MDKKVIPLNKDLVRALAKPEASSAVDPLDRMVAAFRLCTNDAETRYVIRQLSEDLLSHASIAQALEKYVWRAVDLISGCVALRPVQITHASGGDAGVSSGETQSKSQASTHDSFTEDDRAEYSSAKEEWLAWEKEERRRLSERGLRHVPLGFLELFDALRAAGVEREFDRELDDHLTKLLAFYVTDAEPRAPVTTPETVEAVRELLFRLLDILERTLVRLAPERIEERIRLSGIGNETKDDLGDVFAAYVTTVCSMNRYAFDLLYCESTPSNELTSRLADNLTSNPLTARVVGEIFALVGSAHGKSDAGRAGQPTSLELATSERAEGLAGHLYSWLLTNLIDPHCIEEGRVGRVAAAFALCSAPGLLIPRLRVDLLSEACDPFLGPVEGEIDHYLESSLLFWMRASRGTTFAEKIRDIAIGAAATGLDPDDFSGPVADILRLDSTLLKCLGLEVGKPAFDEILDGVDALSNAAWQAPIRLPDESDVAEELTGSESFWTLFHAVYDRLRAFPADANKPGNRLTRDTSLNEAFSAFSLPPEALGETSFPAIIKISRYLDFASQGPASESFFPAFDACIEERLHITAAKLLNYFIVTSVPVGLERGADAFSADLDGVADAIQRLQGRVPMAPVHEALRVALSLYKQMLDAEEDDYFADVIAGVFAALEDKVTPHTSEVPVPQFRSAHASRLDRLSGGKSAAWPRKLLDYAIRVESERDFNLGNRPSFDTAADYPWVLSYHKVAESLLRVKLEFLYEEPFRSVLKAANNNQKLGHFEPFKVLRLLEKTSRKPDGYQPVVDELKARGVDYVEAKSLMQEYIKMSRSRNIQAHGMGLLDEAQRHREWIVANLHRIIGTFNIGEQEIENSLPS